MKTYFVYILTNHSNKVMYIGITNDLERRLYEHKHKLIPGFTQKYNVTKLVHFEQFSDPENAITREKQIKGWKRTRKNALVEQSNPQWNDLSLEWQSDPSLRSG